MLVLITVAGAAALAVIAFAHLRSKNPESTAEATKAVHDLAAVVLVIAKAIDGVITALQPRPTHRPAYPTGYPAPRHMWDDDDDEELR